LKLGFYEGWLLLAHPHFVDQYSVWLNASRQLKQKDPVRHASSEIAKRLAALDRLVFTVIPRNPLDARFLQGNSLGSEARAWRRAKFGGQYRVFFRFDSKSKIIIYGWVNDETTLRAYGSKNDAYLVFSRMLEAGNPATKWDDLLDQVNFE
jgi:toxin YhaV